MICDICQTVVPAADAVVDRKKKRVVCKTCACWMCQGTGIDAVNNAGACGMCAGTGLNAPAQDRTTRKGGIDGAGAR